MKKLLSLIVILIIFYSELNAQNVYSVDAAYKADIKVYVADSGIQS